VVELRQLEKLGPARIGMLLGYRPRPHDTFCCSVLIYGLITSSMATAGVWEGALFDRFWRRVSEVFLAGLLITLFVELFRQGHPEGSAP